MRYWTHWHNVRYEMSKLRERVLIRISWMLPRSIAYWCALRVAAHATTGKWENQIVPELLFMDAVERWHEQ